MGGLFRHVCDLATEQARLGHRVGVVCDASSAVQDSHDLNETRLAALEPSLALGLFRTKMSREVGPADVTAYLAIRRHAADLGIDVLHGHGAKGGAYARLVARSLRRAMHSVVCCYTPHGGSLHYHPASVQGRIYMMLERRLAAHTDALIFESAYSADRYKVHVGAPACSASIVPNGLTPADFTAQPPGEAAVD